MKTNEQKFAELTTYMADVAHSAAKEKGFYAPYESIQFAADRLRLNARLVDTADGSQVGAERYDRESADVFRLPISRVPKS